MNLYYQKQTKKSNKNGSIPSAQEWSQLLKNAYFLIL